MWPTWGLGCSNSKKNQCNQWVLLVLWVLWLKARDGKGTWMQWLVRLFSRCICDGCATGLQIPPWIRHALQFGKAPRLGEWDTEPSTDHYSTESEHCDGEKNRELRGLRGEAADLQGGLGNAFKCSRGSQDGQEAARWKEAGFQGIGPAATTGQERGWRGWQNHGDSECHSRSWEVQRKVRQINRFPNFCFSIFSMIFFCHVHIWISLLFSYYFFFLKPRRFTWINLS